MTITIKLKTDNAAFSADKYSEAHRIVAEWLNRTIDPLRHGCDPHPLRDYNGNVVGTVTVRG